MRVDLIGILEDGSERSPLVPNSSKSTLKFPVGALVTVRLRAITPARVPVSLGSAIVRMAMKRSFLDDTALLAIDGFQWPGLQQNEIDFTILPSKIRSVAPTGGRFVFDVWLGRGSSRDQLVELSPCIITPSAGKLSDADSGPPSAPTGAMHQEGRAIFSGETEQAVLFVQALPGAVGGDYTVTLTPSAPVILSTDGQTERGFTIVASGGFTGTVRWTVDAVPPSASDLYQEGIASFTDEEFKDIVFPLPFPSWVSSNYQLRLSPSVDVGGGPVIVNSDLASTGGFRIVASGPFTGTVRWSADATHFTP